MNEIQAIECIRCHETESPSRLGQAVNVLYEIYKSYSKIDDKLKHSSDEVLTKPVATSFLKARHHIYKLPVGIQWQIDQEKIPIGLGCEISRLDNQNDQWLLALVITEAKDKLTIKECKNIVDEVMKEKKTIIESLNKRAGIKLNNLITVMLPFNFEQRLSIIKSAWNQKQELEDFCLKCIDEGSRVNLEKVVTDIEKIVLDLKESLMQSK